jgi:SAM-dependent methyltransferase
VSDPGWLADTRASYDAVATGYAEQFPDGLDGHPLVRGVLALFAERVREVGGPVVDIGCGTGLPTAYLSRLGVETFGIDLSPGMLAIARRDHPELRFEVGSMTDLDLADGCVGGVLAFYSLIHVPDQRIPAVLDGFHRVLRPGGVVMIGFHVGDRSVLKTEGYGRRGIRLPVHRRPLDRVAGWLRAAGFAVEAQLVIDPDDDVPGGVLIARRPV